ncbi:hypothetical protein [Reinekea sp. G2M2-21]|uniref:hypothetical protein n=1 Tax=Reinekea sp. G2M2-21 TaxID=2788942 RepID=UPI0018AB7363|nr:hypothetical protein [Reinekea sp. G2M2-21]
MNKSNSSFNPEYKRIFEGRVKALLTEKGLRKHRSCEPINYALTTPLELAKWFINIKRAAISPRTFTTYRRSIEEGIRFIWPTDPGADEAIKLMREVNAIPKSENIGVIGLRTSAMRRKRCTEQDLSALQEVADKSMQKNKDWALAFLAATRLTGFRPAEWLNAEIVQHQETSIEGIRLTLRTKTMKPGPEDQAAIAGKLPFRNVPVPLYNELADGELHVLKACLKYAQDFKQQILSAVQGKVAVEGAEEIAQLKWKERTAQFGRALSRLNAMAKKDRLIHKSYPKITLYSARHEFAARHRNAFEKIEINKEESEFLIALLMGHNNPKTQRGYGNVRADEEEVEVVHSIEQLRGKALFIAKAIDNIK